eukprot:1164257-Amorphochlora_amoeboformis.AAC.1
MASKNLIHLGIIWGSPSICESAIASVTAAIDRNVECRHISFSVFRRIPHTRDTLSIHGPVGEENIKDKLR